MGRPVDITYTGEESTRVILGDDDSWLSGTTERPVKLYYEHFAMGKHCDCPGVAHSVSLLNCPRIILEGRWCRLE